MTVSRSLPVVNGGVEPSRTGAFVRGDVQSVMRLDLAVAGAWPWPQTEEGKERVVG